MLFRFISDFLSTSVYIDFAPNVDRLSVSYIFDWVDLTDLTQCILYSALFLMPPNLFSKSCTHIRIQACYNISQQRGHAGYKKKNKPLKHTNINTNHPWSICCCCKSMRVLGLLILGAANFFIRLSFCPTYIYAMWNPPVERT